VGRQQEQGLGVVAAPGWTLEAGRRPTQKWIAPVRVQGPMSFLLLAVWACPVGGSRERNYVGRICEAVTRHRGWFADAQPVVICGDFNSNAIWDHGRKIRNHSAVVKLLRERKLFSVYHAFFSEEHGKETKSTYYFWHRKDRCFHIDYTFVLDSWASQLKDVTIGRYEDWRATSDHVPVVVDVAEV
jgi:exodeoxyribonuclease-3